MNLDEVLAACDVKDGATLSFHHHLRNGDGVLNAVVDAAARRGLRGLHIAASAIFPVHAPLVGHMASGVVSHIHTAYMSGPAAMAVSRGVLSRPIRLTTHGGRARAIESGELAIDVAFVASPCVDAQGNISGIEGPAACGVLGYPAVDVRHAGRVVAVTDHRVKSLSSQVAISADRVDHVVEVPSIGDPEGLVSGITRVTRDPRGLHIAQTAAQIIEGSGLLIDGFSFQTGAGGTSLAVSRFLGDRMAALGVRGSFASGGITAGIVHMHESGLFAELLDVQCFDHRAVESYRRNASHHAMSASRYANPNHPEVVVDRLDCMVLGAAQIDRGFNVNVTTGSDGILLGGSGGHADTAAGAKLAVVTTTLSAGNHRKLVDQVTTVTTPGSTIDVLVTDVGVAVNPLRQELADRLIHAGISLTSMDDLQALAQKETLPGDEPEWSDRVAAEVEYRDGTLLDTVRVIA